VNPSPDTADAFFCSFNNLPSGTTWQIYITKTSSYYYDEVRGNLTVRDLAICIGNDASKGGTFVLGANLQRDSDGRIYQLGYGVRPTEGPAFYYVTGTASSVHKVTSVYPVVGHKYLFKIYKNELSSNVDYSIRDLTTGTNIWWNEYAQTFPWNMNRIWWGYETIESISDHGHCAGCSKINLSAMGWSLVGSSQISYLPFDIPSSWILRGYPLGYPIPSNHVGEIVNVSGEDMFDAFTS
jgi:hypothetical protein